MDLFEGTYLSREQRHNVIAKAITDPINFGNVLIKELKKLKQNKSFNDQEQIFIRFIGELYFDMKEFLDLDMIFDTVLYHDAFKITKANFNFDKPRLLTAYTLFLIDFIKMMETQRKLLSNIKFLMDKNIKMFVQTTLDNKHLQLGVFNARQSLLKEPIIPEQIINAEGTIPLKRNKRKRSTKKKNVPKQNKRKKSTSSTIVL